VEPTAEPTAGLRRVRRFEWTLAGIVAVGMVAAYLSHPVGSTSAVVVGDAEFVPLPAPASARKSDGADGGSTTIVEPLPGPTSLADSIAASRPERTARVENADRERRKAASRQVRVEPQLDVAPDPAPTKEAEKPQVVAAAPAPPQPDRWATTT
jgi:hypothetical protein